MSRPPTAQEKQEAERAQFISSAEFEKGLNWNGDIAKLSDAKLKDLTIKVWARLPTLSAAGLIVNEVIERMPPRPSRLQRQSAGERQAGGGS